MVVIVWQLLLAKAVFNCDLRFMLVNMPSDREAGMFQLGGGLSLSLHREKRKHPVQSKASRTESI